MTKWEYLFWVVACFAAVIYTLLKRDFPLAMAVVTIFVLAGRLWSKR